VIDPRRPEEFAEARRLNERLVRRALAMDGTSTGEHGIGAGKRAWLAEEHGLAGAALMRTLKLALDPLELMNPGKVV
jgi:D-lactate dehydrogenase (cytochrome)